MLKKWILVLFTALMLASCTKSVDTENDPNIDLNVKNWKMTYVWFVATWCPHCKEELPVLDKFYRDFKDQVNMQLIVIDWKNFEWDYKIPEDIKSELTYEKATWDACEYVPSYVIYDAEKNIVDKKCWWKLTYDELKQKFITTNQENSDMKTNTWIDTSYQLAPLKDNDLVAVLTTSNWTIKVKLFSDDTPLTVTNFIWLAKKWYYNWIIFHRVIKNFMIQGWDPLWNWTWWESIYWKEFEDEFSDKLTNLTWSISMANSWKNTNWSQFFINQVDNSYLNWKHTVFGQVVEWMDNVNNIASVKVDENDKPVKEVKIIKVEIKKYSSWSLKDIDFNLEDELKKIEEQKQTKLEANKNREVKDWDKIKVNYTLKLEDWTEFDSSYKRWEPIEFEVWKWLMIKWFDTWVVGMKIWDKKTLKLTPAEAYWEYDKKNIQEVDRSQLKQLEDQWFEVKVWAKVPTSYWEFPITKVTSDKVTIDFNSPLAWKNLTFEVEMVSFSN